MDDVKKVVEGLKHCISMYRDEEQCVGCPYSDNSDYTDEYGLECCRELYLDAVGLMKAQEPRVLTLEEVKAFDYDYCYLEEERSPGKEYRTVCGRHKVTCITWPSITQMRMVRKDDTYGKTWRCWTAKPTDEQRKAVKWDDD